MVPEALDVCNHPLNILGPNANSIPLFLSTYATREELRQFFFFGLLQKHRL